MVLGKPLLLWKKRIDNDEKVRYQTRKTVFKRISNTEKRAENTTLSGAFLTNLKGVWKFVQVPAFMFDISSQRKLQLRRKRDIKL